MYRGLGVMIAVAVFAARNGNDSLLPAALAVCNSGLPWESTLQGKQMRTPEADRATDAVTALCGHCCDSYNPYGWSVARGEERVSRLAAKGLIRMDRPIYA
jgi:hypothetical protein